MLCATTSVVSTQGYSSIFWTYMPKKGSNIGNRGILRIGTFY